MNHLRRQSRHVFGNQKGQVALFIALIFQVLFVFFAMMINVGLLVHHKINLQNSVDLAAYYAAAKQAETLNAIAHTNYQIRQSWKLLNFRMRQLGSYGDNYQLYRFPGNKLGDQDPGEIDTNLSPAFCITYPQFANIGRGPNGDPDSANYCNQAGDIAGLDFTHPQVPVSTIPALGLVSFLDPAIGLFFDTIATSFGKVDQQLTNSCYEKSDLNYFALARFIYAYKRDISTRKRLILSLAENMSLPDPVDLDGAKYSAGISQTVQKNLTYQNKTGGLKIKFLNSLGTGACGGVVQGSDNYRQPAWISEINIYPQFYAYLGKCTPGTPGGGAGNSNFGPVEIHSLNPQSQIATSHPPNPDYSRVNNFLMGNIIEESLPSYYNTSLGFEKNPWCPAYVGIEAETTPQIPFSPFGAITLKATAYAKPFGGTIGPWFSKVWPSSNNFSGTIAADAAMNLKRWIIGNSSGPPADTPDPARAAIIDYPRFVGDTIGTRSRRTEFAYGSAIRDYFGGKNVMSLNWWAGILDNNDLLEKQGTSGDILAYSSTDTNANDMRNLEIAAISPDQYDVTYYSIEPDYYDNYVVRLQKGGPSPQFLPQLQGVPIRGDLGARATDPTLKKFSVQDQIKVLLSSYLNKYVGTGGVANYFVQNTGSFRENLSGFKDWVSATSTTDPWLNFGKCTTPVANASPTEATTGMCITGGRVGYSVKLVDFDVVNGKNSMTNVGGPGTSGQIKNPTAGPDGTWLTVPIQ